MEETCISGDTLTILDKSDRIKNRVGTKVDEYKNGNSKTVVLDQTPDAFKTLNSQN